MSHPEHDRPKDASAYALARMELRASGYPELRIDGQPVPLKLKRGLALLVYLSELGRKVARSRLAELLWPDAALEIGRSRLRRLSHEVNTQLGYDMLVGDGDALWLAGDGMALASDVAGVRAAAQQVLAASDGDVALATLEPLVCPAASGLLDGFELESDSFMAWRDSRRTEHQQLLMRALTKLATQANDSGQPARAAEAASALIRIDPLADAGHAALLAARARLGDAAGVEAAYFACAEMLRDELGIRPSVLIESAYAQAQRQLALRARRAPASQPMRQRRSTLPTARTARWPICGWAARRRRAARWSCCSGCGRTSRWRGSTPASARCCSGWRSASRWCCWTGAASACPNAWRCRRR